MGTDCASDPLVWHGPSKRSTLEAVNGGLAAVEDGPSLASLPLMWAHGQADPLVRLAGSRSDIEGLRGEHFVERIYPDAPSRDLNEINTDEVFAGVTLPPGQRATAEEVGPIGGSGRDHVDG